jgi:release factor glutamine methyltransferase
MKSLKNLSSMRELIKAVSEDLDVDRNEAELVVATLMNRPRFELYMHNSVAEKDQVMLRSRIGQLKNGMPIEYVTNRVQFRNYTLKIMQGVFIPRMETEYFVELIPQMLPNTPRKILEIGTGCGAISIALADVYRDAAILATDVSKSAIQNARENIRSLKLESQISVVQCDLYEGMKGKFDLIVSNPPYVPSERMQMLPRSVREFEPLAAIDGGKHGIEFIKRVIHGGTDHLTDAGIIALEIDEDSVNNLKVFLATQNVESFIFCKDLCNKQRFLFLGAINEKS